MNNTKKLEISIKQFLKQNKSSAVMTKAKNDEILNDAITAFKQVKMAEQQQSVWRIIMKSSITKLSMAAMLLIAISLGLTFLNKSTPVVYANQVLADAIKAVSDLQSVHMKARMRTLPRDNFSNIGLNYEFVPIEMWKQTEPNGLMQWRVEKPGRVLVVDGKKTIMFIRPDYAVLKDMAYPIGSFDSWPARFLNVRQLLDGELEYAKNCGREILISHKKIDGRDKIILEADIPANVPENDYLRNKFIMDSAHLKIYKFDAATKLLEGLQVYVHSDGNDVLIFEITDIEYNKKIDNSFFALNLPESTVISQEPKILPDNEKYQKMSPKEAATAFFLACAKEDWNECLKFKAQSNIGERTKQYLGGLEVIKIGEPFQSKGYGGWFVPYEIRLKGGFVKKHNLALRNDNHAKRWTVDGGL